MDSDHLNRYFSDFTLHFVSSESDVFDFNPQQEMTAFWGEVARWLMQAWKDRENPRIWALFGDTAVLQCQFVYGLNFAVVGSDVVITYNERDVVKPVKVEGCHEYLEGEKRLDIYNRAREPYISIDLGEDGYSILTQLDLDSFETATDLKIEAVRRLQRVWSEIRYPCGAEINDI